MTQQPTATGSRTPSSPRGLKALESRPWYLSSEILVTLIIAIAMAALPMGDFRRAVLILFAAYVTAGIGMNILVGMAGIVSVGHAGFMAVGAYSWALLDGANAVLATAGVLLLSALAGGLTVLALGRFTGYYLALATLAFGFLVVGLIAMFPEVTGGSAGIRSIKSVRIAGLGRQPSVAIYAGTWMVLATAIQRRLRRSEHGLRILTLRATPELGQSLAISARRASTYAFILSAVLAGAAGAILVQSSSFAAPSQFSFGVSVALLVIPIVAGRGHLWAPLLGTAIVIGLPEILRFAENWRLVAYGVLILVIAAFAPEGLIPKVLSVGDRFRSTSEQPG